MALQGADLNIGLLFILAMSSMAVYALVLAGWSSGSKYPLIGGIRASAQAISYEAAMGLAMVAVVIYSATQGDGGTLSLAEIVDRQSGTWGGFIPRWNIFPQIMAFSIFFLAILAETNRAPFDLVEAEQEIVGGFHTEYSGMRFAMFFLAEYVNIFSMSAIAATLFLGGWNGADVRDNPSRLHFGNSSHRLVPGQDLRHHLLVLLVESHLAPSALRPADGIWMEGLIPASLAWLVISTVAIGLRQFGLPWS